MQGYALLYKIEKYSKKIYIFKPDRVLYGKYDKENQVFTTQNNTKIPSINGEFEGTNICVSEPMSKEEFLNIFPNVKNIDEAKKLLLEQSTKILMFGVKEGNQIIIQNIVTGEFEEELQRRNLDDDSYQTIKKRYNQQEEITVIFGNQIEELLSINDLEEFRNKYFDIIIHKEFYQENFNKINDGIAVVITDDELIALLSNDDLEYLKKDLRMSYNKAINVYNQQNDSLIYRYKSFYNQIIFANTKEEISKLFEDANLLYDGIIADLFAIQELTEEQYNLCLNVMQAQIAVLNKLNQENDVNKIVEMYKYEYEKYKRAIEKISAILKEKHYKFEAESETVKTDTEEPSSKLNLSFNYFDVYSKMTSKIIGRNSQIDRIVSTIKMIDNNPNPDKKQSCIIAGTTGTGKTQTFKELERLLSNRPVITVDTNQITQQGYVGGTIEDAILGELLDKAHKINKNENQEYTIEDLELAQHGIVFLDEIDKRKASFSSGPDVNGQGVIDQLLKLMDGTSYKLKRGTKVFKFDTSKLVVFAGGAFQEYFEQIDKKIGYGQSEAEKFFKYSEVDPSELVKYGLSSQFIGRCNSVILYPPHNKETLLNLEKNKETSSLENMRLLFKKENVELVWDDEVLDKLVEKALVLKEGGRSLNRIISRCLNDAYSEIQKYPSIYKIIYLTEESIEYPEKVILIKQDNSFILMEEVIKRNKIEANKKYDDNKVIVNAKALIDARKYKMALQYSSTTEIVVVKTKSLQQ